MKTHENRFELVVILFTAIILSVAVGAMIGVGVCQL